MMNISNSRLVSISELQNNEFSIPRYQRGYRWKKEQITALLEDIRAFDPDVDGDFYCLQPFVVNQHTVEGREIWHVVDGQQRLTTIFLVLRILGEEENCVKLSYERNNILPQLPFTAIHPDSVPASDSPEWFYLTSALIIISRWISKLPDPDKTHFLVRLKNDVKFIWHDLGLPNDREAEHDYFRNLNSGKIELTTSELIKGLFLASPDNGVPGRDTWQQMVAEDFNDMEQWLRNPEVWYFLSGGESVRATCIDLLFNLIADSAKLPFDRFDIASKNDLKHSGDKRAFFLISELINGTSSQRRKPYDVFAFAKKTWLLVREIFLLLQSWFSDCDMYNLIGFILASGKRNLCTIVDMYFESTSKADFKAKLFKLAFSIPGVRVKCENNCKELVEEKNGKECTFLDKKEDARTRAFLLLANIIPLLLEKDSQQKSRFPFAVYHQLAWDVEHIAPQHRRDVRECFENLTSEEQDQYPKELRDILSSNTNLDESKAQAVLQQHFPDNPDCLENYTLLSDHINRGIGDKFFFEKRRCIRDYYRAGHYVPPSSLDVFMKFDADQPDGMFFWDKTDQKAYLQRLIDALDKFQKMCK